MKQTYYDILDLPEYGRNAYTGEYISFLKIKEARDELKFGNNSLNNQEKEKIEEAYRVLSDPQLRKEYDEWLKNQLDKKNEPSFSEIKESKKEPIVEVVEKKEEQNPPTIKVEEKKEEPIIENEEKQPIVEVKEKKEEQEEAIAKVESKQAQKKSLIKKYSYSKIKRNLELVPKYEVFTIEDVKTEETKLIEEYEEKLINEIYDLLSKPPNKYVKYNLQIAKLKYENQIQLLMERIKLKEQQPPQFDRINHKLNLFALKYKLSSSQKKLSKLDEYISKNYDKKRDNSSLNKIYRELTRNQILSNSNENRLEQIEKKLKEKEKYNVFSIKKLEIKRSRVLKKKDKFNEEYERILEKREAKANKMVLHRNGIVRGMQIIIAYDIVKNKIQNLVDNFKEEIELNNEAPKNKKV